MNEKALMVGIFGARGTGKNVYAVQLLKRLKPSRLVIWDHKHDPSMSNFGNTFTDLKEAILAMKAERFHVRYMPDHSREVQKQFDYFCRAAFAAGNLTLMIDELPEVTKANRAPAAWRQCVNVGRLYRGPDGKERTLTIMGLGQRPSECDKSFMNNLDILHTGRIASVNDAKTLADLLALDYRKVMALPDLHWLERRQGQAEPSSGVLSFGGNATMPVQKTEDLQNNLQNNLQKEAPKRGRKKVS